MTTYMVTSQNAQEFEVHKWYIDASELGWKPGFMTAVIETDLGNGRPFQFTHCTDDCYVYEQEFGCLRLSVFND